MHRKTVALSIRNFLFPLCSLLILNGCLVPEGEEAAAGDGGNADAETLQDHELLGSVGDGPVVNAQVRVVAADGTNLGTVESDSSADFSIVVRTKGSYYPLILDASSGTDLVTLATPDFRLRSTVLKPGKKTVANMNPFTTLAMELATDMAGGVSDTNVTTAIDIVVGELGSGLDSIVASGPLETPIDGGNIAEMIKASEVLGEVLRRTRDALQATGRNVSADTVAGALGSDLTDRVIDGRGGARADARTAAVASVAAAQVMLEAMSNRLQVMGSDASARMQDAIAQVFAGAVEPTLDELPVTDAMLASARIGLLAASALQPSATLEQALSELEALRAGMTPAQVSAVLTSDAGTTLDNVVLAIASASAAELELVNGVARSGVLPDANQVPQISGQPQTSVDAGSAYSFTPNASDADGDALTFSISGRPLWAAFDTATGTLSGTPQDSDAGSNSDIVITVSDGESSASLPAFTLTVVTVASNAPPGISGVPPVSVIAGEQYRFQPAASDVDGDTLSFSITGQPAWSSFDGNTGLLQGTPAAADVGTHGDIVITVSDGQASTSLAPFAITVEAVPVANTAPQISGAPPLSVVANNSYEFVPTASDADGDALTFSVTSLPVWAQFDTATGRLSGTPADADVGVYSGIRITVSDGKDSASLGPFDITVDAVTLGSATLSWTPPTQNTDGSALTDLAGYRIYWGASSGNYTESVTIDNPGLTSYVVENLAPGTYEFVSTAFNSSGAESAYSNPAIKTIE